jgi:membrane fusion protein (multidrug efflux system)
MNAKRHAFRPIRPLILALLAVCVAGAGGLLLNPHSDRATPVVESGRVAAGDSPDLICLGFVDVEGGVAPLSPTQPGRILEVVARDGDHVAKGAILLRLDDAAARFSLEQAAATLELAETQSEQAGINLRQFPVRVAEERAALDAAKDRLESARHRLSHQRELRKSSLIPIRDVTSAEDQVTEMETLVRAEAEKLKEVELSNPALVVHEADLKAAAARAGLRQAKYNLEECVLKAPEAGTVLRMSVHAGEVVGGPAATAAVLFCPDRPLLVRVEVEQEFAGRIVLGRPAVVHDEFSPEIVWRGQVTRIADWYSQRRSMAAKPGQFKDVPTVECLVTLDAGRPPFRIGQRVEVRIGGAR